ncbi:type II toxin-antitoxin system HicB family antitoxin [Scytonema sp. UIC 10036]|uniref:type II toxin-antitoxin system HicB family antitoxin n=1 Tax=Scytonema sp. UIC 10036 TaxID=2304196 RepID=UPI0012DA4B59|nr:type II toxin-antitoxin system HicB family antitoxin [Scytonema sp. UIC 10036]MUG97063.1 type II toxin-antitoxin system HicB family antitoxin [Scytonema sp. UIC 10036]
MKHIKIIVEKHSDGYIAYPLGIKGIVVGQGDTYEEALADVKSAVHSHIKTFGTEVIEDETLSLDDLPVLEAFVTEIQIPG